MADNYVDTRDQILNDPSSVIKFFSFNKEARNEFTYFRPQDTDFAVIAESFDNKVVLVKFKSTKAKASDVKNFLNSQQPLLEMKEISKEDFVTFYETSESNKSMKENIRRQIRAVKDIEDDFTDQKIFIQKILYFLSDIWINVLTAEQKEKAKFKDLIEPIANRLLNQRNNLRVDTTGNDRIEKILHDESEFTDISRVYLNKKQGIFE